MTPNMHKHIHLCDCLMDFGPVYAFWLFSFERYNGIMGSFQTNNRSIEIQLMRKFLRDQTVQDIAFPDSFQSDFEPLLQPMGQSGTLGEAEFQPVQSSRPLFSLCRGSLQNTHLWNEISLYHCLPPSSLDCLLEHEVPYLREMYKKLNVNVQEESVVGNFERFSAVELGGERYGSSTSRSIRSSYILAPWVATGGHVETNISELRAGCVKFFTRQNVCVAGDYKPFLIGYVMWYQTHPEKGYFGEPLQVCCKDVFEQPRRPKKRVRRRLTDTRISKIPWITDKLEILS